MPSVIPLALLSWGLVAVLMLALWLVQVKTKNASFVDIGWTLGLAVCAAVYAAYGDGFVPRKGVLAAMVFIWALRLCSLLVLRLWRDPGEDARYRRIREGWKAHQDFKFFLMFQFQAFLDIILSLPFVLICLNPKPWSLLEIIGAGMWCAGLAGEITADEQLRRFKQNPAHKGKTCDAGLWHYSRHPNYFFEWLMWLGYFTMALAAPWGWTAIIAPALMLLFLLKVSGVTLAEAQALKTRGEDYRRYQQTTSMFVPLPKRSA